MSDMLLKKLLVHKTLLIDDDLYRLVGDYSEVQTRYDYEFENVENEDDTFMVSVHDLKAKLGDEWTVVEIKK